MEGGPCARAPMRRREVLRREDEVGKVLIIRRTRIEKVRSKCMRCGHPAWHLKHVIFHISHAFGDARIWRPQAGKGDHLNGS